MWRKREHALVSTQTPSAKLSVAHGSSHRLPFQERDKHELSLLKWVQVLTSEFYTVNDVIFTQSFNYISLINSRCLSSSKPSYLGLHWEQHEHIYRSRSLQNCSTTKQAPTWLPMEGAATPTDRQRAQGPVQQSEELSSQMRARAGVHSPTRQPPAAGDTSVISFLHPHRPARRRQTRTQGTHAPACRRTTRQPPPRPNEPHCSPAQPSDAKRDGQAWGECWMMRDPWVRVSFTPGVAGKKWNLH